MIISGWISLIFGIILSLFGVVGYNDSKSAGYGLYQYADSSDIDTSRVVITIGIILLLLGIVLLIIGYIKKSSNKNNSSHTKNDLLYTHRCLKCGTISPQNVKFCPKCGNNLHDQ